MPGIRGASAGPFWGGDGASPHRVRSFAEGRREGKQGRAGREAEMWQAATGTGPGSGGKSREAGGEGGEN